MKVMEKEKEIVLFEYETPELTEFADPAQLGIAVGDSACTDVFQELDGFDF